MSPSPRHHKRAIDGDFIKDLTSQKRSLGMVMEINKDTRMMYVNFPKIGRPVWLMWENYGHYIVV